MSPGKQEIIRQVNEMIDQLKNKTFKSPFSRAFAEVFIEDGADAKKEEAAGGRGKEEPVVQETIDPNRQVFLQMRQLSRDTYRVSLPGRTMREYVFYQQAKFMAAYEDDYQGEAAYSMYYPSYQMMSYEQLRTYFTWRTQVRMGNVKQTDLSYVFVYVYELINGIGVANGEDGIQKLMALWNAYRGYTDKLDKYMAAWVRDYYIINECSFSFDELLQREDPLRRFYPRVSGGYSLDAYNELSSYKIKQSIFFTQDHERMLEECFAYSIEKINRLLKESGVKFEDLIFYNTEYAWHPFSNAVYYPKPEDLPRGEKTVAISESSLYRFKGGKWTYTSGRILTDNGRKLVTYLLKRMEQLLRKASKFKYKLYADSKPIDWSQIHKAAPKIGSERLLAEIDLAVKEYCINSRKTVVTVDQGNLEKIRRSAMITQEKLIVPADGAENETEKPKEKLPFPIPAAPPAETDASGMRQARSLEIPAGSDSLERPAPPADQWEQFAHLLNPLERLILKKLLRGASVNKAQECAKDGGVMLEVLIDGINQKAIDSVGDTILELSDEITVYDEYRENVRKATDCEYDQST